VNTRRLRVAVLAVLLAASACTGGGNAARSRSSSDAPDNIGTRPIPLPDAPDNIGTRPIPLPVSVRPEPDNVTLADPKFDALPAARAAFGRLAGAVYQIEMPDRWNGRLILFMHGFGEFRSEARVGPPDIRAYLVAQGYAWGSSSFSSTGWVPGRATDETAALWDHFTATYGRPQRTYVIGESMGGAAANIAAERYPDRFDGALALCGSAGATSGVSNPVDVFVVGAFVAGVTQADYDATTDIGALIRDRIRPALEDPQRRDRFERIMVDLSGGPRPFDRDGIRAEEETDWHRAELAVSAGVVPHHDTPYHLGPASDVSDTDFNRSVLHLRTNDDALRAFVADNEATGNVAVPLLTMHTTGDGQVPIEEARILQRLVDKAGHRDLLVQRVIRDAGHCGFTNLEQTAGFEALVGWVEHNTKPDGNDVLTADMHALHPSFELEPRPGTPEADTVVGAADRVVIRGTATVDGAPLDARFFGADVAHDGLMTHCQYQLSSVTGGAFELTVRADTEQYGCGAAGSTIVFWTYVGDSQLTQLHSTDALPWPGPRTATATISFSTTAPLGASTEMTSFVGEVLDASGHYVPPGTRIEAFVGDVRCGETSTSRTDSFSGYTMVVAGPDAAPGCTAGAPVSFRVDGQPARQHATNDIGQQHSPFDLTLA
jgi:pimeloyl-ACP methyl ester carboxylesterase